MKKIYFLIIIVFLFSVYNKYTAYINLKKENEIVNMEILKVSEILQSRGATNENFLEVKEETKNFEGILESDSEFLKIIYTLISEANLELIDNSSIIVKEENEEIILNYVMFKLKGSLEEFYTFLVYTFFANKHIDNKYSILNLDGEYFQISLGYLRRKE